MTMLVQYIYIVMFVLANGWIAYNVIWIRCQNGVLSSRCYSMLISVNACM